MEYEDDSISAHLFNLWIDPHASLDTTFVNGADWNEYLLISLIRVPRRDIAASETMMRYILPFGSNYSRYVPVWS